MIDRLSDDLQEKIFCGLESRDLGRVETVCRSFLAVCRERRGPWERAMRQSFEDELVDSALSSVAGRSPRAAANLLRDVMPQIDALLYKALDPTTRGGGVEAFKHWYHYHGMAIELAQKHRLNIFQRKFAGRELYRGRPVTEVARLRLKAQYLASAGRSSQGDPSLKGEAVNPSRF